MNQIITLNLIPNGIPEVAYVSQCDVGREIICKLYEGTASYSIPSGATLTVNGAKEDRTIFEYGQSDGAISWASEANTVTITTLQQMTVVSGDVLCQIRITKDGDDIGILNFIMRVMPKPMLVYGGDAPSTSELPALITLATEQEEHAAASATAAASSAESAAGSATSASNSATSAAGSATSAENSATSAENSAISAAESAQSAIAWSAHPPYIGANGNWYVWNTTDEQYEDSGIDASITVTIADITMLAPDATPTVTNSGSNTDPIFHLGIPRGKGISGIAKTGASGLVDTYTITYSDGYTSTFTVTNGKSAYQYATEGGYSGTESDFYSELAGIHEYAEDSEAYATGKRGGTDVGSSDPAYHNNAKYYAEEAEDSATAAGTSETNAEFSAQDAEAYAVGKRDGVDVPSTDPAYHNNAKYYSEQASSVGKNDKITVTADSNALTDSSTVLSAATGENPTAMASHALSKFWTYISGKITGAISGILTTNLTASRAVISNSSGKIDVSDVTSTELGYLDGVTGSIQNQLDGKVGTSDVIDASHGGTGQTTLSNSANALLDAPSAETTVELTDTMYFVTTNSNSGSIWHRRYLSQLWTYISGKITGAISGLLTTNLTPSKALTSDANGKVTTSDITTTELSYLDDARGNVQSQIDGSMELTKASVGWSGKNLIAWPKVFQVTGTTTTTEHGVTCTMRSDGSILANGTVTEDGNVLLNWAVQEFNPSIYGKRITINGASEHVDIIGKIAYSDGTESTWLSTGMAAGDINEITVKNVPIKEIALLMPIHAGDVITNEVVYPMVYDASILDDTYEPYHAPVVDTVQQTVLKDAIGYSGKNLIGYPGVWDNGSTTQTYNGVTATKNSDGSVTLNGTATDSCPFLLNNEWHTKYSGVDIRGQRLTLNGSANASAHLHIAFTMYDSNNTGLTVEVNNTDVPEYTFTVPPEFDNYAYFIYVFGGEVYNNVTVYPMIRRADVLDPTYEPYHAPVSTLSDNIAPTEGVTASGAYTAGSYIIWQDGNMYQVTTNVSQGTTWAVGTNLSKSTVGNKIQALEAKKATTEGYLYNGKFYKESSHTTEIAGEAGVVYVDLATNEFYRYLAPATITLGQEYTFGGFTWIAAEQLDTGIYAMQSTGMTGGTWPGYKLTQDYNGTTSFGTANTAYGSDINYLNIANYDTTTQNWYDTYGSVEASGGCGSDGTYGATTKNGLYLIPNSKAGTTTSGNQGSGNYWSALKTAAAHKSDFGASSNAAWLGTVHGSSNAWAVGSGGNVGNGGNQNGSFVVAPAFNIDTSKIYLTGTNSLMKGTSGFVPLSGETESSVKSLIESYITYGTSEMTAGESALADGSLYFQYE